MKNETIYTQVRELIDDFRHDRITNRQYNCQLDALSETYGTEFIAQIWCKAALDLWNGK